MNEKIISFGLLRQRREQLNISIEDVIRQLEERGIKISGKTLYGYENGVGTPKVSTFIALCDIYGIDDILGAFGVRSGTPNASAPKEKYLISLYQELNDEGQEKLIDYADDLVTSGKYIKSDPSDVGQEQA